MDTEESVAEKNRKELEKRWEDHKVLAGRKDALWELCGDFISRNRLSIDTVSNDLVQEVAVTFVEALCSIRNPSFQ